MPKNKLEYMFAPKPLIAKLNDAFPIIIAYSMPAPIIAPMH